MYMKTCSKLPRSCHHYQCKCIAGILKSTMLNLNRASNRFEPDDIKGQLSIIYHNIITMNSLKMQEKLYMHGKFIYQFDDV